jgi:hypothetical protein
VSKTLQGFHHRDENFLSDVFNILLRDYAPNPSIYFGQVALIKSGEGL